MVFDADHEDSDSDSSGLAAASSLFLSESAHERETFRYIYGDVRIAITGVPREYSP